MRAPFVWSWSRHQRFGQCERAYWYSDYGARHGWRPNASPEARELYRLKRLVGRSQWLGQLAHDAIATVLRAIVAGEPLDEDALVEHRLDTARRQIEHARHATALPDGIEAVGFLTLERGQDPGDEAWNATLADLAQRIADLRHHPITQRLRQVPARIMVVDDLKKVTVEGTKLWAAPDVLVADGHGGAVIIDWKTGGAHDPEVVARQLGVYAWWVHHDRGIPAERLKGVQANVPGTSHITVSFDEAKLAAVARDVEASVAAMLARLPDPHVDDAPFESFEPLPLGADACERCVFSVPCGRRPPPAAHRLADA